MKYNLDIIAKSSIFFPTRQQSLLFSMTKNQAVEKINDAIMASTATPPLSACVYILLLLRFRRSLTAICLFTNQEEDSRDPRSR